MRVPSPIHLTSASFALRRRIVDAIARQGSATVRALAVQIGASRSRVHHACHALVALDEIQIIGRGLTGGKSEAVYAVRATTIRPPLDRRHVTVGPREYTVEWDGRVR